MGSFLSFLATQRDGILMLLLLLIVIAALVQWLLWMVGRGRFRKSSGSSGLFKELTTKIIYEFRHLLALVTATAPPR